MPVRRRNHRIALALSLLLGAVTFAASPTPPAPVAPPEPGTPAPGTRAAAFASRRIDGGTFALESLRGHVVLVNFWALNCPPCRIEMPELEKLHRRYADRGVQVIGVTEMNPADADVKRYIAEIGVSYPIVLDPGARIGTLYGIEAHPTSVVIDARGIVRFVNSGYLKGEEKDIENALREALGEKP